MEGLPLEKEREPMNILFVCLGNTCRSQMAEGFARAYGDGRIQVRSAGTAAYGEIVSPTIEVMGEKGIDISGYSSEQLTGEMIEWADVVVSMACQSIEKLCSPSFKGRTVDWEIHDPYGESLDVFRRTRDEIEDRVKQLLEKI